MPRAPLPLEPRSYLAGGRLVLPAAAGARLALLPAELASAPLDHIAFLIADAERPPGALAGLPFGALVERRDHGIRARLADLPNGAVEAFAPLGDAEALRERLASVGEAVHHIALRVDSIEAAIAAARAAGLRLVDERPRPGLRGNVAFLHPSAADGLLVELVASAVPLAARHPHRLRPTSKTAHRREEID